MISIFTQKEITPSINDLQKALGKNYKYWLQLQEFTKESYPWAVEEWNFASAKYGWSFRIKDKKRAIVYLLPRDKYFKAALVFGQKATDEIMQSTIADSIKEELKNARVYAEGRGIRIDVKDSKCISDIKNLILVKIAH